MTRPAISNHPCTNGGGNGSTFHNAAQTETFPTTPSAANSGKRESVSHRARQTAGQLFGPKSKNVDVVYKCFKCILFPHKDPLAKLKRVLRVVARLSNNVQTASDSM